MKSGRLAGVRLVRHHTGCPCKALAKRMPELENINIRGGIVMWPLEITKIDSPADHFTWNSWHMGGLERKWIKEGFSYYAPIRYSELPGYYRNYIDHVDVAMMQVARWTNTDSSTSGRVHPTWLQCLKKPTVSSWKSTENMPRCLGGFEEGVHISKVDMIVEGENPGDRRAGRRRSSHRQWTKPLQNSS